MATNNSLWEGMKNASQRLDDLNASYSYLRTNMDVLFLFLSGDIVLLLQAGFAFLQCGVVRTKNTTNILLVTLMDLYISGIAYFVFGWAFSRGHGNAFIGWTQFALVGTPEHQLCDWFYRCVVAALVATLISGAVAERCNVIAHNIYSAVVSGFIFPVVAHWAWSDQGWLKVGNNQYHYVDFAGSGTVHLVGGVCSFVAAAIIGPRIGRFDPFSGRINDNMRGHSLPMSALGGFILVFGLISFNAGARRTISAPHDGEAVALAVSNTMIAGSFGSVTALLIHKSGICGNAKQWSFLPSLNGAITAMVATCAAGDHYPEWGSPVVGIVGAFTLFGVKHLVLWLKVDDPLDAVAVHFGGGAWGLIAAVLFARKESLLHSVLPDRGYWALWNLAGMIAITFWSAGCSIVLFGIMKKLHMLRVSPLVELRGLDQNKHGEPAYPVEGWEEEQYTGYSESVQSHTPPNQPNPLAVGILPVMMMPDDSSLPPSSRRSKRSIRTNPAFVPEH